MCRLKLNIQLFAVSANVVNERNGNYSVDDNNEWQKITFTVKRTSGTTYWSEEKTLSFTLTYNNDDGTTTTLTQSIGFSFPSGSVGYTKTAWALFLVPHKLDGTQSITYDATITTGTSAGTLHPTGSAILETIPRASSISVPDANIGSSTNIAINKASASFTTTLEYKAFDENSWTTIATKTPNQVYGWTVPTSFYSKIPSVKTMTCQFRATTYLDNTQVGDPTITTATFTATGNPILNSATILDVNSTTTALTGDNTKIVKYASNMQVSISASGQNSATISSASVNGLAITLSGTNPKTGSLTINGAITGTYQVVITDSRGYSTTTTYTQTVIDYVPLTINATIVRNQPTDGKILISYSGNYYNNSFGSQNNSLTVQYRSIEKGGSWTGVSWNNLSPTLSGNTYSQTNYEISNYDYTKQYEFQIQAIDKVQTKSIVGINVTKGQPIFYWDENGLYTTEKLIIPKQASGATTGIYDSAGNELIKSYSNNDTTYNASGGTVYLGYKNTTGINFMNGKATMSSTGQLTVGNCTKSDLLATSKSDKSSITTTNSQGILKTYYNVSDGTANLFDHTNNANAIIHLNKHNGDYDSQIGFSSNGNLYYKNCNNQTLASQSWNRIAYASELPGYTNGSFTITKSSGNSAIINTPSYAKYGKVVSLFFEFKTTSSTSAGNNVFVGTISGIDLPKVNAMGVGYYGSSLMVANLTTSGTITVRVIAASLASSNDAHGVSITYVCA